MNVCVFFSLTCTIIQLLFQVNLSRVQHIEFGGRIRLLKSNLILLVQRYSNKFFTNEIYYLVKCENC